MTLVAIFIGDQSLYMVGDVMLSVGGATVSPSISYPTKPISFTASRNTVVGLRQKIVCIKQNMYLSWAGPLSEVIPLITYLKYVTKSGATSSASLKSAFDDYLKLHRERVIHLQLALVYLEDETATLWQKDCSMAEVREFGSVVMLGSGTEDITNYLDTQPLVPFLHAKKIGAPEDADRITYILQYILQSMSDQYENGFGLDRAWGAVSK